MRGKMKYKITIRKPEEKETGTKECYLVETDEETFASHLNALVEDIDSNQMV